MPHPDFSDVDELVELVRKLIGQGFSVFKVSKFLKEKMPLFNVHITHKIYKKAMQKIVQEYDAPPSQFRGSILQAINNIIDNPKLKDKVRLKAIALKIKLAAQLSDVINNESRAEELATLMREFNQQTREATDGTGYTKAQEKPSTPKDKPEPSPESSTLSPKDEKPEPSPDDITPEEEQSIKIARLHGLRHRIKNAEAKRKQTPSTPVQSNDDDDIIKTAAGL